MATPTNQTQVQVAKKQTPEWFLENQFDQIKLALPKHIDADRMRRICLTELRRNERLRAAANANPLSFFGAVIQAAQLGLEPGSGLGHCYLIPYKNEVTFQLGYQGMIELVMRTGKLLSIMSNVVCEGEDFDYMITQDGLLFRHRPDHDIELRDESNITRVYALAKLVGGGTNIEVLSKAQVNRNEEKNRKGPNKSGPWSEYWAEMARKTAIRKLYKQLPKSPELAELLEKDGESENGVGGMAELARQRGLDKLMGDNAGRPGGKAQEVMSSILDAEAVAVEEVDAAAATVKA